MKRNIAHLPLHTGRAPAWLFAKMKILARLLIVAIIEEYGTKTFIERLSDPYWFQSFGCVLGFDWHSSGLTTTTLGAIKEALRDIGRDYGIFAAGGKGRTSRSTPEQLMTIAEKTGLNPEPLIYTSKIVAKVDSAAYQDNYDIYAHTLIFDKSGNWSVVQQGMNNKNRMARRYHWFSDKIEKFTIDPHAGVIAPKKEQLILNMTDKKTVAAQSTVTELSKENPDNLFKELKLIREKEMSLPRRHQILLSDINPERIHKILLKTYDSTPKDFEKLLMTKGVGAKTIRALSLISDIVYGAAPSYSEPEIYTFAHGGKDGTPFPVDRHLYDKSIEIMRAAVRKSKIGERDKLNALKNLQNF